MIIYKLTSPSGKCYIGQTRINFDLRFRQHTNAWKSWSKNKSRKGVCTKLFYAFESYNPESWSKEILYQCQIKEELDEKEEYYIQLYDTINNGYNITKGGSGRKVDFLDEEHKENISNSRKEFFETEEGLEWKDELSKRYSGEGNPMFGKGEQISEQNSKWYLLLDLDDNEIIIKNLYQFRKDNIGKTITMFPNNSKSQNCKSCDFRCVILEGYSEDNSQQQNNKIIENSKKLIKPIGYIPCWNKGKTGLYKQTDFQKQRASETKGKTWIVIDPEGNEFEVFSLNKFCKENGLDQGNLSRGKHKGYKAKRKD